MEPAHPALVSEADFIAAQDASAPRGPAGTARLAALAILHAGGRFPHGREQGRAKQCPAQITAPALDQIDQLRAGGVRLIYDPVTKTLRTDCVNAVPVAIS